MGYLLDTHVLLWFWTSRSKLSGRVLAVLSEEEVAVSMASLWEIALKFAKGKLPLPIRSAKDIVQYIEEQGFALLPIGANHIAASVHLPDYHADPFDRMLVAQAQEENLLLITDDAMLHRYGVQTLPAR